MEGQICMDWDGVSHISTLWVQDNQCHCILCYTYTRFSVKKLKFILSSPHYCAWQGAGCAQVPLYSKERDRHFCHVGSVGLSFFFFFFNSVSPHPCCARGGKSKDTKGGDLHHNEPQKAAFLLTFSSHSLLPSSCNGVWHSGETLPRSLLKRDNQSIPMHNCITWGRKVGLGGAPRGMLCLQSCRQGQPPPQLGSSERHSLWIKMFCKPGWCCNAKTSLLLDHAGNLSRSTARKKK